MFLFRITYLNFIALAFSLALFCSCADDLKAIEWLGSSESVSSSSEASSSSESVSSSSESTGNSSSSGNNQINSSSSVDSPYLSGTCELEVSPQSYQTYKMVLVDGNSTVIFHSVSIENRTSDCEGPYISLDDGKTPWQEKNYLGEFTIPNWKADTMLIAGKAYAKCGETLLGPIDCRSIKIKNPLLQGRLDDTRDGQIYQTVTIQDKEFMAENLNYAGSDGNLGKCYNDSISYCNKYGRLYDDLTAQSVCPSKWRLLNDSDLLSLEVYNLSNFTALPGGYFSTEGYTGESEVGTLLLGNKKTLIMNFAVDSQIGNIVGNINDTDLYSVRCVQIKGSSN
jgi:hypothetical protein